MSIAICPGSFDPITLGHLNIIRRTARIFDEVVVVIMQNSTKKSPMFTVEEKLDMVRRAVSRYAARYACEQRDYDDASPHRNELRTLH